MLPRHLLAFALAVGSIASAFAATTPAAPVDAAKMMAPLDNPTPIPLASDRATTRGGSVQLIWNDDLLHDLGLDRSKAMRAAGQSVAAKLSKNASLEVNVRGQSVNGLAGGEGRLTVQIGFERNGTVLDWSNPQLLVRPGIQPRIDFRSENGEVWFYADTIMYELLDGGRTFQIRSADLHIAPDLAVRMNRKDAADIPVAELKLLAPIEAIAGAKAIEACGTPNWPGTTVVFNGTNYIAQADVFLKSFTGLYSRCGICDAAGNNCTSGGCDGPGPADGRVVLTPSSTLINNRSRPDVSATALQSVVDPNGTSSVVYAADVPWYQKFSNNVAPYYDQHPYLIWNVYRRDTDGTITQIGRSGIKHAFLTTNQPPGIGGDSCENCNGSHVLGRACSDTYGTGNNDSNSDLGPRNEVIPASGLWGRCGSIYDQPPCGTQDVTTPNTSFMNRLLIHESDLQVAGAKYIMESWYVVRDDVNIYNTMGTHEIAVTWNGTAWTLSNGSPAFPYTLGPAIDGWVSPAAADATHANNELSTPEGHAKVAVKVTDNGDGTWRYDYVVMNFDFSRAVTTGAVPNLTVVRNHGFNRFTVSKDPSATISAISYGDGDTARTDWAATSDASSVSWTASDAAQSMEWGVMARFSFTADAPPLAHDALLGVTEPGTPTEYTVTSIGVGLHGESPMFQDGFE